MMEPVGEPMDLGKGQWGDMSPFHPLWVEMDLTQMTPRLQMDLSFTGQQAKKFFDVVRQRVQRAMQISPAMIDAFMPPIVPNPIVGSSSYWSLLSDSPAYSATGAEQLAIVKPVAQEGINRAQLVNLLFNSVPSWGAYTNEIIRLFGRIVTPPSQQQSQNIYTDPRLYRHTICLREFIAAIITTARGTVSQKAELLFDLFGYHDPARKDDASTHCFHLTDEPGASAYKVGIQKTPFTLPKSAARDKIPNAITLTAVTSIVQAVLLRCLVYVDKLAAHQIAAAIFEHTGLVPRVVSAKLAPRDGSAPIDVSPAVCKYIGSRAGDTGSVGIDFGMCKSLVELTISDPFPGASKDLLITIALPKGVTKKITLEVGMSGIFVTGEGGNMPRAPNAPTMAASNASFTLTSDEVAIDKLSFVGLFTGSAFLSEPLRQLTSSVDRTFLPNFPLSCEVTIDHTIEEEDSEVTDILGAGVTKSAEQKEREAKETAWQRATGQTAAQKEARQQKQEQKKEKKLKKVELTVSFRPAHVPGRGRVSATRATKVYKGAKATLLGKANPEDHKVRAYLSDTVGEFKSKVMQACRELAPKVSDSKGKFLYQHAVVDESHEVLLDVVGGRLTLEDHLTFLDYADEGFTPGSETVFKFTIQERQGGAGAQPTSSKKAARAQPASPRLDDFTLSNTLSNGEEATPGEVVLRYPLAQSVWKLEAGAGRAGKRVIEYRAGETAPANGLAYVKTVSDGKVAWRPAVVLSQAGRKTAAQTQTQTQPPVSAAATEQMHYRVALLDPYEFVPLRGAGTTPTASPTAGAGGQGDGTMVLPESDILFCFSEPTIKAGESTEELADEEKKQIEELAGRRLDSKRIAQQLTKDRQAAKKAKTRVPVRLVEDYLQTIKNSDKGNK